MTTKDVLLFFGHIISIFIGLFLCHILSCFLKIPISDNAYLIGFIIGLSWAIFSSLTIKITDLKEELKK